VTDIPQEEEIVTCVSCDYRYPRSWGACNICGAPAPTVQPAARESDNPKQVESEASEIIEAATEIRPENREHDAAVVRLARRASVLVSTAAAAIAMVGIVAHRSVSTSVSDSLVREIASVSAPAEPALRAKPAPVRRTIVNTPASPVAQLKPAKVQVEKTEKEESDDTLDPARLWQMVRRGNTTAEVTLAKLYLEGEALEQNCEQAHLLLVAASKRGSRAADNLLGSAYTNRCN